ncbi:hypothetical protein CWI84_06010 [Idiomarina tyrosinivorans]|uniref:VTT domain-containing protein n=1 Tax=Idiomarina tyrosinivorans TaxID=1445662 RepID=A0A432ZRZ9_9GAMM|nr:YqaA family protein [Idiomarina tyrosinivorans]RUO80611.1 hypothetical protein CWI84_06010 [Idiomarina tyrosinivorans]
MKIFSALYQRVLKWSSHPKASYFLAALSCTEAVFFPIPPDVMLAPMALARPQKAWHYALIATLASAFGGVAGYLLGFWAFDTVVQPMVETFGYQQGFVQVQQWFETWGVAIVFIAGFSPIPYKLFTVTAGMMSVAFIPFLLASVISRGLRFYLVAGLMKLGGAKMEAKLQQWIDTLGWALVALVVIGYGVYQFLK